MDMELFPQSTPLLLKKEEKLGKKTGLELSGEAAGAQPISSASSSAIAVGCPLLNSRTVRPRPAGRNNPMRSNRVAAKTR